MNDCGFEELHHLSYSPKQAPRDYYLFSNLKKNIRGRKFNNELQEAIYKHFSGKTADYFSKEIKML